MKKIQKKTISGQKICSIFGQRLLRVPSKLKERTESAIRELLYVHKFRVFLFCEHNAFDEICHEILDKYKQIFPDIKKIFVVAQKKHLNSFFLPLNIFSGNYDKICYMGQEQEKIEISKILRSYEMLMQSQFALFYVADMERTYSYFALQFARQHKIQFANLYQFEEDFEIDAQTVVFD